MTPEVVRRRVREIKTLEASIGERYTLALEVFLAIAENRCTYPQMCAREMLELEVDFR